jgi:hypothetical protein
VPEQNLDQTDVDLLLQQVGGKGMAQGVHRNAFLDAGFVGGRVDGAIELAGTQMPDRILARKQPAAVEHLALGTGDPPPDAQAFQQQRREHGVAILLPLALLDPQGHALAVDVADLQGHDFADAQAVA